MEDTYVSDDRASSPISLVVVVSDGYMSRDLLLLFNFCFFFSSVPLTMRMVVVIAVDE